MLHVRLSTTFLSSLGLFLILEDLTVPPFRGDALFHGSCGAPSRTCRRRIPQHVGDPCFCFFVDAGFQSAKGLVEKSQLVALQQRHI